VDSVDEYRWMFAAEYPAVVRTVYLVLHDYSRSEEIAQDAFVQLLRHWNKVRRYEAPGAWVRRVAIRLATATPSASGGVPY
jgi:DNA-directed RNA polymerase specialized sigma24 family protein